MKSCEDAAPCSVLSLLQKKGSKYINMKIFIPCLVLDCYSVGSALSLADPPPLKIWLGAQSEPHPDQTDGSFRAEVLSAVQIS